MFTLLKSGTNKFEVNSKVLCKFSPLETHLYFDSLHSVYPTNCISKCQSIWSYQAGSLLSDSGGRYFVVLRCCHRVAGASKQAAIHRNCCTRRGVTFAVAVVVLSWTIICLETTCNCHNKNYYETRIIFLLLSLSARARIIDRRTDGLT